MAKKAIQKNSQQQFLFEKIQCLLTKIDVLPKSNNYSNDAINSLVVISQDTSKI